jgi:hypothetical protein
MAAFIPGASPPEVRTRSLRKCVDMVHTPKEMTETSFNVSQPRLGAVDTTTGNSGKLHMMVKVDGYDFLSQVTWNRDLKK